MALYNFKDIAATEFEYDDVSQYSGDIEYYDWDRFNPDMLTRSMLQLGSREPKAPAEGKLAKMETVKQLYKVCTSNPVDAELKPGMTVSDIYCSRANADAYTERPVGARMMELRYIDCTPESRTVELMYPYNEDASAEGNFMVKFFVSNPNLYNILLHRLYNYEKPVIVYTDWTKLSSMLTGSIEVLGQVLTVEE